MRKDEDLMIARALGCYARITSKNGDTLPDAIGDRYRTDVEGRRAFWEGWHEGGACIAAKALNLVLDQLNSKRI